MNELAEAPARRRPWIETSTGFLAFAVLCALVIIGAALLSKGLAKGSPGRIALAVVEGVASAAVIVGMFRNIRRCDELQQKIHLDSLAFSFAMTGILATGYGFLVTAGLPDIDWATFMWPAMMGLWAIGYV